VLPLQEQAGEKAGEHLPKAYHEACESVPAGAEHVADVVEPTQESKRVAEPLGNFLKEYHCQSSFKICNYHFYYNMAKEFVKRIFGKWLAKSLELCYNV